MKKNRKGRSKGDGRYLRVTHFMMGTSAWQSMSAYGRAAYLEIAALYDGANNGYLAMGVRRMASAINVSEKTANKAIKELLARGFIEVTEESGFSRKDRRATEFRLTDHNCDRTQRIASKAFQKWRGDVPPVANDVAAPRSEILDRRAA